MLRLHRPDLSLRFMFGFVMQISTVVLLIFIDSTID